MKNFIRKTYMGIRKELLHAFSYTYSFFLHWFFTLCGLTVLYLLPTWLNRAFDFTLDGYTLSYFYYIVSGMLINIYLVSTVKSFVDRVETMRSLGLLESLMVTPTHCIIVLLSMYLERFIFFFLMNIPFLSVGIYFLTRLKLHPNIGALIAIFILAKVLFFALGLLLASWILLFNRGRFLVNAVFNLFRVFCNIIFPATILPRGLQYVSACIPVSYVFRSFRDALFNGESSRLPGDIALLALWAGCGLWISIIVFNWTMERVRKQGILSHY